jgi:hypothetical protein
VYEDIPRPAWNLFNSTAFTGKMLLFLEKLAEKTTIG